MKNNCKMASNQTKYSKHYFSEMGDKRYTNAREQVGFFFLTCN